jgi:hypothetical protein
MVCVRYREVMYAHLFTVAEARHGQSALFH